MGKWTTDYYDEVVSAKFKALVTGAIKRSKLEKGEPTITYETFVEDLDIGDSFTTSLVDILVKEMADRRLRQVERRLIADKTAKSLRMLATPLRIYHERPNRRMMTRRTVNLTDYLSAPPEEMEMDEDEDEFDSILENAASVSPFEGARINSDLYDAYGGHASGWAPSQLQSFSRRSYPSYSAAVASASNGDRNSLEPIVPLPRSPPASTRNPPWSLPPMATYMGSSSGLPRQPSVRRSIRSRAVDFNDFTRQRRSTTRNAAQEANATRSEGAEEIAVARPLPTPVRSPMSEESSTTSVRRFFPVSRSRRHDMWGPSSASGVVDSRESEEATGETRESSSRPWFLVQAPVSSAATADGLLGETDASDDRPYLGGPRLRRGGLRAPEAMLSRETLPSAGVTTLGDMPPDVFARHERDSSGEPSNIDPIVRTDSGSVNQLPTPRSDTATDDHELGHVNP